MLEKEIDNHAGCPYRHTCTKNEEKCCYLVKNECIIFGEKDEHR